MHISISKRGFEKIKAYISHLEDGYRIRNGYGETLLKNAHAYNINTK